MRIHTRLQAHDLESALNSAEIAGKVGGAVSFAVIERRGSRTHPHAYEVQLGTDDNRLPAGTKDQYGKNMRVRRNRNTGETPDMPYAATWHEWGWFLNEVFKADPEAKTSYYESRADFDRKTGNEFAVDRKPAWTRGHP